MDTQKGYLLVVEDIPDILRLLDTTLSFKGYRVVTASNGEEALEIIQKERPAMVITDILMPRMDGFSLVHRLRINPETRDIPVVFLSATYIAPEDKAFALTIGATRFIEKPVDFDEFLPTISELLAKGAPATTTNINEIEFYEGYRQRLKTKLDHKSVQITRDQHLLDTLPDEEKPPFAASLHQAVNEREEIKRLIAQIDEQLKKSPKPQ